MQDFRNLKVWEKAHQVVLEVYRRTAAYPRDELYGLVSQTRRAAVSITVNIAEGCGRGTDADFARFLQIALGSALELDALSQIARDLGYLPEEGHGPLVDRLNELKRMLNALLQKVRTQAN